MSERGAEFLLAWVEANVRAADYPPDGDRAEAGVKEKACLDAAEALGISRAEIEAEVGSLSEYMHVMMSTPSEDGVVRLVFADEGASQSEQPSGPLNGTAS